MKKSKNQENELKIFLKSPTLGKNTTVYIYDYFPTLHNITIYDEGLKIVYHNLTPSNEFVLPILDVGTYKIVVANLGNENITGSEDSEIFEVTMDNFVEIVISDVVYGRILPISIVADVDGYYYVDINGTEFMMEVIDGFGYNDSLNLGAGFYYANVTFDNPYYDTHIYNTTFNIYQAESNIEIYDIKNVTYGKDVIIEYIDDYNATFEILIINEDDVVVEYIETDEMKVEVPFLAAGNYTVIVTNWGNENITGLSVMANFTVYKADSEMNVTVEYNEINVVLPEDATGEVSIIVFYENNITYNLQILLS